MSDSERAATTLLVGRLLLASAAFIAVVAVLFWTGVFPLDERVRLLLATGAAVAALADALLGTFFIWKSTRQTEKSTRP